MVQETQVEHKASGVLGGVAKFLNSGGRLMVKTYDLSADLVERTVGAASRAAGAVTSVSPQTLERAKGKLAGRFGKFFRTNEKLELRTKVNEYEEKIKKLYYEIGKEGSSAEKLESEKITELIGKVRDYEQEIQRLQTRITEMSEMDALRREEAKKEKVKQVVKKVKVVDEQVEAAVRGAIDKAVKHGQFDSDSQKEIFKKIATDLLDEEMEVRILAAAELGKMGIKPVVDVLMEAVKFDNVYLTAEIINSLTNIGDSRTLSLCKEMAKSPSHRVRISSLRGLYKMGADGEIASYLIEALNDEHHEVRRTATTFLGWKDMADSVPGLIQTLQDKDESVRKSAVTALMNLKDTSSVLPLMRVLSDDNVDIRQKALEALRAITGEEITFNVGLKGKELGDAVNALKNWWQTKRIGELPEELMVRAAAPVVQEAPASEDIVIEESSAVPEAGSYEAETISEETTPEALEMREEDLRRKLKSDLIDLCRSQGVECDETNTKAELIAMLLSKQ